MTLTLNCLCTALTGGVAFAADLDQNIILDIPANTSLEDALLRWGAKAGVTVMFASHTVADLRTTGLQGTLPAKVALKRLLDASGLLYETKGDTVLIISASENRAEDAKSFRIAQETPTQDSSKDVGEGPQSWSSPASAVPEGGEKLAQVVVTGTNIAGVNPTGSALKVYTREDIDQSGAATLDQFARQMPESFSGVDAVANVTSTAHLSRVDQGALETATPGTAAFNLYGLGTAATLTLLNGHRLAPAGLDGSLTDISQIPLSAIDHIEVLSDGASAIYGADAVAGVVNIVTRKDFEGAETQARVGTSTEGGGHEFTASQAFGTNWHSGTALLSYEFDKQGGLDASQRSWIPSQGGPDLLLPESRRNSLLFVGRQDVATDTSVTVNAIYSVRNFFGDDTQNSPGFDDYTDYSGHTTQTGVTLTLDQTLSRDWHVSLTGDYSALHQRPDGFSDISGGFSELFFQTNKYDSSIGEVDAQANGSVIRLPGGMLKAAFGLSFRGDRFSYSSADTVNTGAGPVVYPPNGTALQRHVTSTYGELFMPVVGEPNRAPGIYRLELSAAARLDHYSDFGSTTNPKVGLLWSPIHGLDTRATYGTSFQAPLLTQLGAATTYSTLPIPDASSPSGMSDTLFVAGGNPELRPQTSKSFTAGFDLTPQFAPHLHLSGTYFHTVFSERIATPPIQNSNYLNDPTLDPYVDRNPSLAQVEADFQSPYFSADYAGLGPAGVSVIFDDRYTNVATSREAGVNLSISYSLPTEYGRFDLSLTGVHLITNEFQAIASSEPIALLNTFGEPTKWKGHSNFGWSLGKLTSLVTLNYINSYQNNLFTPSEKIGSWTTADLYLSYVLGDAKASSYLLRNLSIAFSIQNLANTKPPFVSFPQQDLFPGQNSLPPFDPANASPLGRFLALGFKKKW